MLNPAAESPIAETPSLGGNLSILIPAFNEEAGIGQTLRSLLVEPRLSGAEIIVIDDGSTDRTAEIVRAYPQVRLLQHPFNRG